MDHLVEQLPWFGYSWKWRVSCQLTHWTETCHLSPDPHTRVPLLFTKRQSEASLSDVGEGPGSIRVFPASVTVSWALLLEEGKTLRWDGGCFSSEFRRERSRMRTGTAWDRTGN